MTRFQSGESLASQVYAFDREFVLPSPENIPEKSFESERHAKRRNTSEGNSIVGDLDLGIGVGSVEGWRSSKCEATRKYR